LQKKNILAIFGFKIIQMMEKEDCQFMPDREFEQNLFSLRFEKIKNLCYPSRVLEAPKRLQSRKKFFMNLTVFHKIQKISFQKIIIFFLKKALPWLFSGPKPKSFKRAEKSLKKKNLPKNL